MYRRLAHPKSISFKTPLGITRMFPPLMSLQDKTQRKCNACSSKRCPLYRKRNVFKMTYYLPMNDVVAMEIGDAWQQLLSVTTEHGLVKTSKSAGRKNIKLTFSAQLMHYLLITIDQGVANNLTNSNAKCSSQNAKHQKTKQKQTIRRMRKGTLPSKYGGNGAPWNVLHEDVHHAPV